MPKTAFRSRKTASLAALLLLSARPVLAGSHAVADVAVVVDTSVSMKEPGMDPERTSLLVTKLLADIVPGELAAVRLLDLAMDAQLLPSRDSGIKVPCTEDPSQICTKVEPASDWHADARRGRFGVLPRPARGDAGYKKALESHLLQASNNSPFSLAFRAAQGVFDGHQPSGGGPVDVPRTLIWLSDGRDDDPSALTAAVRDLQADGVGIEAIVFGKGDPGPARQLGLDVRQVSTPAELMKAFAGAFRRVVQAPYEVDNQVAVAPTFEIKPQVDEAWVVVYGNDTLGTVRLDGPGGTVTADYAADRWAGAGAYRVAYLTDPAPGTWTVSAEGGGPGAAYAVVQWSALGPVVLAPEAAVSGLPTLLVAGVQPSGAKDLVTDPQVLSEVTLTAEVQGSTVALRDDGTGGDATAGDGRFSATITLKGSGTIPVQVRLQSALVDRMAEAQIRVSGEFRYRGGPVEVDLGRVKAGEESCRPLSFSAEHRGEIPFELRLTRSLPTGHRLEVRSGGKTLAAGAGTLSLMPESKLELCLVTTERAPSSQARAEPTLELAVAGSTELEQRVPIHLSWEVAGLTFWQRWGWLILWLLALLVALFVAGGYILPHRFAGTLALTFVPDRGELEEHSPQPVKQWRGVRIGFYRNARAYLHGDFRLSGNPQGALALLQAERGGARVAPGKGGALSRETLEGGWEPVPALGRKVRAGDVYRIGERGPYFRVAVHRGRG